MIGSALTIRSPSTTICRRSTPWVAGCCGPMLSTMSAVASPPAPTPTVSAWRWPDDAAVVSVMGESLRPTPAPYAVWPLPGSPPVGQSVGVSASFDLADPTSSRPLPRLRRCPADRRRSSGTSGSGSAVTTTHAGGRRRAARPPARPHLPPARRPGSDDWATLQLAARRLDPRQRAAQAHPAAPAGGRRVRRGHVERLRPRVGRARRGAARRVRRRGRGLDRGPFATSGRPHRGLRRAAAGAA